MSRYDLVVFGASGYTGQFVAEEIARTVTKSRSWAVAGRNRKKLEAVLVEVGKHVGRDVTGEAGVLIADINDQESLKNMCSMAKVVISCVGPFRFWGAPVIEACISEKCHYVDICGETEVMEDFQDQFHDKAEQAGIHIVQSCGFDSIPADLGMLYTIQSFPGYITQAESIHRVTSGPSGGSIHTGTWESLVHGLANAGKLRKKRSALPPIEWQGPRIKKRGNSFKAQETGRWTVPFPGSDVSVVRRSQRARQQAGQPPVQYGCYFDVGSFLYIIGLMMFGMILYFFTRTRWGINFAIKHPRLLSFGAFNEEGSTRKQLSESSFTTTFYAKGFSDKSKISPSGKPDARVVTRISGAEPGYLACSTMVVQCALCLLKDDLPNKGGVLTPAVAFAGTNLISEMDKHGVKFSIVESS